MADAASATPRLDIDAAARRNPGLHRILTYLLDQVASDGDDSLLSRVEQNESDIATAQATADTANGKVTRLGSDASLDTTATGARDTGFNWPGTINNHDAYLVIMEMGTIRIADMLTGEEIRDLTNGTVGTALAAGSGTPLYERGTTTIRARIGKTASGDVLIDATGAGNADTQVAVYRIGF